MPEEAQKPTGDAVQDAPAEGKPEAKEESKPEEKKQDAEEVKNPYVLELERLRKDVSHKERVIQRKEGRESDLLAEVKRLTEVVGRAQKPPEAAEVDVDGYKFPKEQLDSLGRALKGIGLNPEELSAMRSQLEEVHTTLVRSAEEQAIERAAATREERELIRHHLTSSVRRTKDLDADVALARVLANRHLVEKREEQETATEAAEARAGAAAPSGERITIRPGLSPANREALRLLKAAQPGKKWEKHFGV